MPDRDPIPPAPAGPQESRSVPGGQVCPPPYGQASVFQATGEWACFLVEGSEFSVGWPSEVSSVALSRGSALPARVLQEHQLPARA